MRYFDAHAHIQFPEFDTDRDALLGDLATRAIGALIVGVDRPSSEAAIALADPAQGRYAAVGLHPNYVQQEPFDPAAYRALAADSRVVAIGECGLDSYRPADADAARPMQQEVFRAHIALAADVKKPLMVHARPTKGTQNAYHELAELLREGQQTHGPVAANIHFFVGGVDEARALLDLGCTVSYTAVLTFARDYDEVVRYLPLDRILTETDSPYAAPPPRRGSRNDPGAVEAVVAAIAAIRSEDEEIVRAQLLENARRVFSLPE